MGPNQGKERTQLLSVIGIESHTNDQQLLRYLTSERSLTYSQSFDYFKCKNIPKYQFKWL